MLLTTEHMDVGAVTDYTQVGAGVAGILNGAKLIFGTNNITPNKHTAVADLTQSPDADLAPVTITWGSAFRDANGDIVTQSQLIPVKIAVLANATTIKSVGLTDAAGANLLASEDLGLGYQLTDLLSLWNVQIPFSPPNPQGKGSIWSN
jgi:hypothetical protein